MNVGTLLGKLTPFANKSSMIVDNQSTKDIMQQIIETHNRYKSDYDKIAQDFWKGSVKATCQNLFNFLKKNVQYCIEPDTRQSVKSPAAILATGKYKNGGNDCKHYSLFQAGVLDALKRKGYNIDFCYRFANYKLFQTIPHHVFVVVKINGVEYWCDPVLDQWNQKKPYINKIDKKMSLYSISGIGRVKKHRAAKVALFPARKAFLLLVRINFNKFALKLWRRLHSTKRNELLAKWQELGGDTRLLETTVNKAVVKWNRKHPNKRITGIGAAPAAAAIIAAAAPIIAALLKFLKPEKADEIDQASDAVQQAAQNYSEMTQGDQSQQQDQQQDATVHGYIGAVDPYFLYGGLGLGILYLMTAKKYRK